MHLCICASRQLSVQSAAGPVPAGIWPAAALQPAAVLISAQLQWTATGIWLEQAASYTHPLHSCQHTHTHSINELNITPLLQALVRAGPPSTPSISRVKANSTVPTAPPREALEDKHRGPTPTNRYSHYSGSLSKMCI